MVATIDGRPSSRRIGLGRAMIEAVERVKIIKVTSRRVYFE